jgi:hypothetical protein
MRLISAEEELAEVSHEVVIEASICVSEALRFPGDRDRYLAAVRALQRTPLAARWIVELLVEVELAANRLALHYPSGIRRVAS